MILVLDDEVQPDYRYLAPEIARILPESDYHVYADDTDIPSLDDYDGVVVSGSTASVYDDSHPWIAEQCALVEECVEREIPVLGVCFGHQLVNWALGGDVVGDTRRATFVEMEILEEDEVLEGIGPVVPVLHADLVTEPGEGMVATARTDYSDYFCTRHESAPVWTVQFHPEFTERVADRPSDWSDGDHSFEECNAHEVLTNFARACTRRVEA
jgi:GMP synthase (glutamine-hydrolysing)